MYLVGDCNAAGSAEVELQVKNNNPPPGMESKIFCRVLMIHNQRFVDVSCLEVRNRARTDSTL